MAKFKSSDIKKVGIGFGVGVATTIVTDKLVIPAVKKGIANKKAKAAKATVDVNVNSTTETNSGK